MLAIFANDRPTARILSSGVSSTSLRFEHRRVHSIDGIQPDEAAEDAFGRGAVQLLMRDGARQRMKRRVLRAGACA